MPERETVWEREIEERDERERDYAEIRLGVFRKRDMW